MYSNKNKNDFTDEEMSKWNTLKVSKLLNRSQKIGIFLVC